MKVFKLIFLLIITLSHFSQLTVAKRINNMKNGENLKILALGDSLTEGYFHGGALFHPYTETLSTLLKKSHINAQVVNEGISGEMASRTMVSRLQNILDVHNKEPFHWIILLAGTNDVLHNVSPDRTFHSLLNMYQLAYSHNASVLGVTIPQHYLSSHEKVYNAELSRRSVNMFLHMYHHECNNDKKNNNSVNGSLPSLSSYDTETTFNTHHPWPIPKSPSLFVLFDLDRAIPFEAKENMKPGYEFWDDNIHFSPLGYDHMGELIFKKLFPFIKYK
mmetsp:Transcript_19344/g.34930  ORF Transcript_19344/g.34930 Transcript_19344/m.34930 type:complete len:276 (-) Transcript_19344:148-975(-)